MRTFIILVLTVFSSDAFDPSVLDCTPRYHFWRPFFGELPADKFVASSDYSFRENYIGKVVPLDFTRSWTFSTQLNYDYATFAYEDEDPIRVDRFLEIMCVSPKYVSMFRWKRIKHHDDMFNVEKNCCLVKGGVTKWHGQTVTHYIGRIFTNTTYYHGPAFFKDNWWYKEGLRAMEGDRVMHFLEGFEVLTYRCLGGF